MTRTILALSAALALALPAEARSKSTTVQCKDGTTAKSGRGACSHHGGVAANSKRKPSAASKDESRAASKQTNDSKSGGFFDRLMGRSAPAPRRSAPAPAQKGAPTATCKDGTTSYSEHHSGTCSGHGGVAQWLDRQ